LLFFADISGVGCCSPGVSLPELIQ
jgi:hypothetical protein